MVRSADRPGPLSLDVEPRLWSRIERAASDEGLSASEFVVLVLRRVVDAEDRDDSWSRLSSESFARDWNSDDDAVYDALAKG